MKTNFTQMLSAFSLVLLLLVLTGCPKPVDPKLPIVNMLENAVVVGPNTAVLYAEVTDDGGGLVRVRGFCYGKEDGSVDTLFCEVSSNRFSVELADLTPMTAYTCQAFASNEAGRGYSSKFSFTTENDTVPRVKTWYVREVTYCAALASGQVLGNGGQTVEECGLCYGTELKPTIEGMHVVAGSGVGSFDCQLTDLSPETQYWVRAYAICTKGVYYGEQLEFETKPLPMEVHTLSVSDVTASRLRAEGEVIRDGGSEVRECGFCWGTEHNPTIAGLHTKVSIGLGEFGCYFSGLERGRTNYVRAYAINAESVAYGNELELIPDDSQMSWPSGTLPGLFSVAPDRQVRFSQGNLQYYPDDNLWRFAEHQWDFVGGKIEDPLLGTMNVGTVYANGAKCDNTLTWKYYEGWMDLFGWGTSGWNNGNEYYHPYDFAACPYHCASYGPVGNFDLTGDYAQSDWGVHNTISNGGSRQWYTPTVDELVYLITERETASGMRFAKAVVTGVSGMILFPDDWDASTYAFNGVNEHGMYNVNIITGNVWVDVLEPAGAVFLPAAGERYQVATSDEIWYTNGVSSPYYINGCYWTTTQSGVCIAHGLAVVCYELMGPYFVAGCIKIEASRCDGISVRLISEE